MAVAVPTNVVTLDAGKEYVKLDPLTDTGDCAARERCPEVIHGVTEAVEKPLSEKDWEIFVPMGFTTTIANDRFAASLKAVMRSGPRP